jgi:hypothetical protein
LVGIIVSNLVVLLATLAAVSHDFGSGPAALTHVYLLIPNIAIGVG